MRLVKVNPFFFTFLLLGLLVVVPPDLHCQGVNFKYFTNYSHEKEVEIPPQNFSILQDKRGIIYVGNNGGVIEFDGISRRLIPIPNKVARSLTIDDTGTIYVGGKDELGFLTPGSKGTLQYQSLLGHLKANQKDFSDVWRTHRTKDGIYFRTSKFLFRWNPGTKRMNVWETSQDYPFKASFVCGDKYFLQRLKTGLMHIVKDSLKLVPGGEAFASERIYMMAQYDAEKLLIGTRSKGFYIYDGIKAVPFPTGADDYLHEKELYYGIRLSSSPGDFALATLKGGLVIIDENGRLKEIFNKDYGLLDDMVWYVFEDFQGNLWLGFNQGIAKIEYNSPFSIYDDRSDLPGLILTVVKHQNNLYAGTTTGLYFPAPSGKFLPVAGIPDYCRSLLSIGNSILAATNKGVFQVENENRMVIENESFILVRSRKDKNRIWVGTGQGLVPLVLTKENGQWRQEHTFENITKEIHTIVEDEKGNLWLGTRTKGVLKVDFSTPGTIADPAVTSYHTSHNLPAGEVNVFMAADHVMFASPEKGIFRFDEKNDVFIPDSTLGNEFADGSIGVFRILQDKNKSVWFHSRGRNIQAIPQPDGTFLLNKKPFLRLSTSQVNTIYPDPDGNIIWFARDQGLIRFDTRVKKNYHLDFAPLIRKVLVNGKLVFDGYKSESKPLFPVIEYNDRNLRFMFAAPFFEEETKTKYRYLLEGYDDRWSDWTGETQKDYTNLDSGVHTFRVQAKNVYEHESKETVFQFKILPPWYKTWWAFSIYGLLFFLLVFFIVKWRSGKLVREKQHLEQIVKDRTKEIEEKKQQLEEQSEQLKELDKLKSRFFANISHEFRTPLTLIMGPLEQMLSLSHSQISDREQKKKMKMMLRNSQRLLNLINQLLDLSRLDSGKMKLQAVPGDIIPFIKGITASFEIAAEQNELDLQFRSQEETAVLYFDPEKVEKIMLNLLSNAVKFTPPGGRVTVSVTQRARGNKFLAGSLEISVSDTGIGIPESQVPHIFDHFYQVNGRHEHKDKGSGIGLALTKELVILHRGDIEVRSSKDPGSGTEFIVHLPLGKGHLEPGEIVRDSEPAKTEEPPSINNAALPEEDDEIDMETGTEAREEAKNIILIVEDNADARRFIRDSLEPLYTVVEAADGREGIEKAGDIIPDLIISDIMMPEKDGYELCRVLKQNLDTSHVPIILLTARAADDNIVRGLETGADDYITKPFNTRMLLARIKNLIELRRQLHMNVDREMTLQPAKMNVSSIDKEFIKELQAALDANLEDPDFNVEDLGKKLYLSRATLYRKVLALSGKSPSDYIRSHRLKRAALLLKSKSTSVTEVAFEVGFSSRTYFTKCFKEKFHQLPSEYHASES